MCPGTFISHLLNIELLDKGYLTNFVFCVVGAVTVLWIWKKLFDWVWIVRWIRWAEPLPSITKIRRQANSGVLPDIRGGRESLDYSIPQLWIDAQNRAKGTRHGKEKNTWCRSSFWLSYFDPTKAMERLGGRFIDCQFGTPLFNSMGGRHVTYEEFMKILRNGYDVEISDLK